MIRRAPKSPNPFIGMWRIVEMELWDKDYIDLEGPGSLSSTKGVTATLDLAQFKAILIAVSRTTQKLSASSSLEGNNDADPAGGVDGQFYGMAPCTAACSFTAETIPHFAPHSRRV